MMASNNDFFTSSPTVVAAPNVPPNGYFNGAHYPGSAMNVDDNLFTPGGTVLATTPGALAGRKRSRGDIHAPDEEEQGLGDGSISTPVNEIPPIPRQQFELNHLKRPSISTRKSQRVDATASASDNLAQLVLPPQMREITAEPLINEATRVLGISWVRMDSTDVLRINSAASAKWIQNHYPNLKDVSVWFEYSAIPCYLVHALNGHSGQQEYYLFSQDLKEARLVTSDATQLVPRLKMLPALELAAPGGAIHAQEEPTSITASVDEGLKYSAAPTKVPVAVDTNAVKTLMAEDDLMIHGGILRGFCSAHEMEMD